MKAVDYNKKNIKTRNAVTSWKLQVYRKVQRKWLNIGDIALKANAKLIKKQ